MATLLSFFLKTIQKKKMGGHGGLNILPQKKWNVYNRDNRLKVARDEADFAEQQKHLSEKHAAAETQQRLRTLKERARQRHGGAATINLDEHDGRSSSFAVEAEKSKEERVELVGGARNKVVEDKDDAIVVAPLVKRQRREPPPPNQLHHQREQKRNTRKPAASLDEHATGYLLPSTTTTTRETTTDTVVDIDFPHQQQHNELISKPPPPPSTEKKEEQQQRFFNLFAEEELRARNPEKAAEERVQAARRGDPKTHTTDEKFDERFKLAYGLGGRGAPLPWYSRPVESTLVTRTHLREEDEAEEEVERRRAVFGIGGSGKKTSTRGGATAAATATATATAAANIEEWRRRGRDALANAAAAAAAAENSIDEQEDHDAPLSLLQGVKIIPGAAAAVDDEKTKNRSRHQGEQKDRKRKKKDKTSSKIKSSDDVWRALREERLQREATERKRETEAIRVVTMGSGGGPGDGRRYHSSYGGGR